MHTTTQKITRGGKRKLRCLNDGVGTARGVKKHGPQNLTTLFKKKWGIDKNKERFRFVSGLDFYNPFGCLPLRAFD
jgi:hypothetical protein